MKAFRTLNISGTLLNKEQLSEYMEKIALNHDIKLNSDKDTYPIPFVLENYKIILETYRLLNEHIKLGIKIHSAGEWILDNFYIIEENVKSLRKELNFKKYKKMIGLYQEKYRGFARIFVLSAEIAAYTDNKIDRDNIYLCLEAYQKNKLLSNEEINMLGTFLKIVIINNIAQICKKIYLSQMQKIKVESIIERLIEQKSLAEQVFSNNKLNKIVDLEYKYSFIEYMSYRLKKYGKKTLEYQDILEEEVSKAGLSVLEVIQKEHSNIANLKIVLGNCIKSLKEVNRIDFFELLGNMNGIEDILNKDPADTYKNMDEDTKSFYRNVIEKLSKRYKISEIYITEKILELAQKEKVLRKRHVGFFLIGDGIYTLKEKLINKKIEKYTDGFKSRLYIGTFCGLTLYLNFILTLLIKDFLPHKLLWIILYFITLIPISEIVIKVINYIMSKCNEPVILPKMDYSKNIPEECTTAVVIPTILKDENKVEEMLNKLEVYYLANKYDNLYFVLLGDCTEEDIKETEIDKKIINFGINKIQKLNEKYYYKDGVDRFHFIYRQREWNESEGKFIGWERKRGLLVTFNNFIKSKRNKSFLVNTIDKQINKIHEIKYIITLDSDTNLVLESAPKLIGAMDHILNKPVILKNKIIQGYGIMQPRIGLDLESNQKSKFVELYGSQGGIDLYTNAISDIYQDYFREGIFTGKGIYNVKIYNEILKDEIPENTVLSHDLLEGIFLRCGLLTDVMLLDEYPTKYLSYINRNHRWIRGDVQIVRWLKSNRINEISKFKIFDNLRRGLIKPSILLILLLTLFLIRFQSKLMLFFIIISFTSLIIANILDIINFIIFKESTIEGAIYPHKKFSKDKNIFVFNLYKMILEILFLPYEACKNVDALVRSIYRMRTKKKLLEWTTAEDNNARTKNNILSIIKEMKFNIVFALLFVLIGNIYFKILGFMWFLAPFVVKYISKENLKKLKVSEDKKIELLEIGKRTWNFFEENISEESNFLISDNYQEDRKDNLVKRTSSTNIGLEFISIISAYDLGYIDLEKTFFYLNKLCNTVKNLPKWNGHLYNWYTTDTLEPLKPRYISTVDSGNFVGYLYIVKSFLCDYIDDEKIKFLHDDISNLIDETDFSVLYSAKNKLFSIGFNLEENKLTDSYYDFLASEARQASLIAIAKKQVPTKHWNSLSRTITSFKGYKGLISWTGTSFEYLMPNLNLKNYKGSLLDESSKFAILSQKVYCGKLGVPWGISESAFNLKDLTNNYQYKAFGIPWLGLKRGLENDLVVSPYSTFLALNNLENTVFENIKRLKKEGAYGKYGFYESIDYTKSRLKKNEKIAIVKTYMAHHQGLILNSINNYLNDFILRGRFNKNPEIDAVNILLEERMPAYMIITKEKKEKPEKLKFQPDIGYVERYVDKNMDFNVIANEHYMIFIDNHGNGYSKYKNFLINRYHKNYELKEGINFYIRDAKLKNIINLYEGAKVIYAQDKAVFSKKEGTIKYALTTMLDIEDPIEIRSLEIENLGSTEEILELFVDFVPILLEMEEENAHPSFNSMFLSIDRKEDKIIIKRVSRDLKKELYLVVQLYTENGQIVDKSFEIDADKYYGREDIVMPKLLEEGGAFSNSLNYSINKVIAQKQTIRLGVNEKVKIHLLLSASESEEKAMKQIENKNAFEIEKISEISKIKVEEEMKYLQITREKFCNYCGLMSCLLKPNNVKDLFIDINKKYEINNLWKFGISGDLNILVVKIRSVSDIEYLEEIIDAYIYFRIKNVFLDMIVLNEESNVYKRYVKEEIDGIISNKQIDYLKNIKTGIFILNVNEIENEDLELIYLKAKVIIDVSRGSLKQFLKLNNKSNYIKIKKNINKEIEEEVYSNKKDLKFFNNIGGFSEDFKRYIFYPDRKLKTIWSNVIGNKIFGAVITENMLDICWFKNSRLNRLTSWNNDTVKNISSQIIYFKDLDNNKVWSLNNNIDKNKSFEEVSYGFGWGKYKKIFNKIEHETIIFVPNQEARIITNIKLKNLVNEERNFRTYVYFKLVLGEDENRTFGNLYFEKLDNYILVKNIFTEDNFVYITSNCEIKNFTKSKNRFLGKGNINYPDGVFGNVYDNKNGIGDSVAIELEVRLKPFEEKELNIILGQENDVKLIHNFEVQKFNDLLNDVKNKWNNITNVLVVNTPDEDLNALINGWLVYQSICCRIWGRTAFYQSGGAYGFRDQLQDCLGMKYVDIEMLREQIIRCASHQFVEGDVLHWWHEEIKKGCRTRFSDDLLWMVYGVLEYIEFTGEYNLLDEEVQYIVAEKLEDDVQEKYVEYHKSEVTDSIYQHCLNAINRSCNFGENGFPKIGSGDWNDGFSNIGAKGKGESVWLGFFLYDILNRFIKICDYKKDEVNYDKYFKIKEDLKRALNTNGWDGRWFKRAITDNGEVIGSLNSDECKIDSISQSWSVISDAADNDKKHISMQEVENYLVDKENKIIKLFTPPFKNSSVNPGYIKAYPSGVRENGGQYTHAAIWVSIAFAKLGYGEKAIEFLKMINPINHSYSEENSKKYRLEPYVIPADIYDVEGGQGVGGWSWYTGSSSWYYKALIEYIVGMKIENNYLVFKPVISKKWKKIDIHYKYKTSMYNIKIKNVNLVGQEVEKVIVNGEIIENKKVLLVDNGKIYNVEVILN